MEYGLIGKKLGHSYSKILHEMLCDYTYELCQLPDESAVEDFFAQRTFKAINVTIPYKKLALKLCDVVDEKALSIGAVNTVVNKNGKLYGYNTDYAGFSALAKAHGINFTGKKILILGTGGTAVTAKAVCKDAKASEIRVASREAKADDEICYKDVQNFGADVIINTTPVGMYPKTNASPLNVKQICGASAVLDAIYNPFCTEFLHLAHMTGIPKEKCAGGLEMLIAQAVFAIEHFLDTPFAKPEAQINKLHSALKHKLSNVCLIGMPSCGKTTLGKKLAKKLDKTFIDIDEQIENTAQKDIPSIFATEGETVFRTLEREQVALFAKENSQIISCGGGAVLFEENIKALKQNGLLIYIDRPLEQLLVGGNRPLSTDKKALASMEKTRRPIYEKASDIIILNDVDLDTALERTINEIYNFYY